MNSKQKQVLRDKILILLKNQKEEDRIAKSLAIAEKLYALREFYEASTILFYASFGGEVDTFEMMRTAQKLGKKIGLPRIDRDHARIIPVAVESLEFDLSIGSFGIKEPRFKADNVIENHELDMVLVPGLAFDLQNNRLGRGGGYYDRFLAELPKSVSSVGLAYDFQMIDSFPFTESHDVAVKQVLTN